jgi:RND family efflux transporter MFP subunit
MRFLRSILLWHALLLVALVGCSRNRPTGQEQAPPTVTVSYPIQEEITDYADYPGRTAAVDFVQVRARVGGYLEKVNFKDGQEVKERDILLEIDPRPYQFALNQAEAQVTLQEANVKYQEAVYQRNLRLYNAGQAVAQEELQQSLAQRDTARASLNAAQAAVKTAQLNLEFTKVRAPISGRISRTLVTTGNLVVADQTLLTTIVSLDPIYAYFDVDEPTVLRIQKLIREGKFKSAREKGVHVPVHLGLATEKGYPHEGFVDFINNQVSTSTGTLQVRAVFPNPKPAVGDRVLSPGLFVRIRVSIGQPYQAVLINQVALGTDQNLKFVYVVNDENQVERRDVQLGPRRGSLQVILEGLKPDEGVIVSGLQRVRPRMAVTPHLVPMPATVSMEQRASLSGGQGAAPPTPQPAPSHQGPAASPRQ